MKDLIDRKALGVGKCSEEVLPHAYCVAWNSLIDIIEQAPAVDAVEVVRCKECEHWTHVESGMGDCTNRRFHLDGHADPTMKADDFCSCGERRTE